MKRAIATIIILVLISCDFGDSKNSIDKILVQDNYTMECHYQGCFGAGVESLQIMKGKENIGRAIYTYLDYSKPDGPHEKKKEITWNNEKERILKEIFEVGIDLKDTKGFVPQLQLSN